MVVWEKYDLLIDDAQGVGPIASVGVFSDLGLPSLVQLLRLRRRDHENRNTERDQQSSQRRKGGTTYARTEHIRDRRVQSIPSDCQCKRQAI